jgi:predicted  nucleic acid-binding Zn-ribbon protein
MQITPLWQKFKQLGLLDRQLIALTDARNQLIAQIKTQQSAIANRKNLLEHMVSEHKKISHEVWLKEADITAVVTKLTAKEHRLKQAQSRKEELALEHEIEALKKICHGLEDVCLEQMAHLETINRLMTQDTATALEECKQEQAVLAALKLELEAIELTIASNQGEQEIVINTIAPEWFKKYQGMKANIPDPIAPVVQNSCGSCFYEVLAQDLVRLKLNAILPCRSCFRLLYCDTEKQA